MSNIWVTTDWHAIEIDERTGRKSISNSFLKLTRKTEKLVQQNDIILCLGDIAFRGQDDIVNGKADEELSPFGDMIRNMPGYKILVKGNHDGLDNQEYLKVGFQEVGTAATLGDFLFTHKPYPVSNDQVNVHGHTHHEHYIGLDDGKHIAIPPTEKSNDPPLLLLDDVLEQAKQKRMKEPMRTVQHLKAADREFCHKLATDSDYLKEVISLEDSYEAVMTNGLQESISPARIPGLGHHYIHPNAVQASMMLATMMDDGMGPTRDSDILETLNPDEVDINKTIDESISITPYDIMMSQVMNENIFLNDDDLYYNKDKFDSGEINLCFITGLSGSGKSTMGMHMRDKTIEHYELDDLLCVADHFSMANLKEYGDLIYSFFKGPGKKYYVTLEYLKKNNVSEFDYEYKLFPDFVHYAMKYAKLYKDKKFILEGIWLFCAEDRRWFNPKEFDDYAVYIKNTSVIVSMIRAAKRDASNFVPSERPREFVRTITKNFKRYFIDEKLLSEFRSYFIKKIKEQTKSISEVTLSPMGLRKEDPKKKKKKLSKPDDPPKHTPGDDWDLVDKDHMVLPPDIQILEPHISENASMISHLPNRISDESVTHYHDSPSKFKKVRELRVESKEITNPNDTLSNKAVKLTFYDKNVKIGEASISAIDTNNGFLYDFEVFKQYRGRGYGRRIMQYIMSHYSVTDLTVDSSNMVAINLYKSFGFKRKQSYYDKVNKEKLEWYQRLPNTINETIPDIQILEPHVSENASVSIVSLHGGLADDFHEVRSDYEPPERKALRLHKKALEYKLANLDEGAVDYLLREIRAYKIRFDRHGNVRITKRETNHLKEHFNNSVSLLRAYRNADDVASVKQECMKLRYMSEILLKYYIRPNNHSDEMKELINLRSTILNALNTNLKWVKQKDPKYNFAEEYDRSKYGSDINLPRNVIRDATKTIVTLLV